MVQSHSAVFLILSVIVAIFASFAALSLAGRVRTDSGATRLGWVAGGATVLGLGIWSMHFVGMLAFRLPVQIAYDLPLVLLSVSVAIAASLLALTIVTRPRLGAATLLGGGISMGAAIAGMHYIGMASMRVDAYLTYGAPLVVLSVAIAIGASIAALWLTFRFRTADATMKGALLRMASAVTMGFAISGMHYTAMAAARFTPGRVVSPSSGDIIASGQLGAAVTATIILIIVLALIGAVIDRNIQSQRQYRDLFEKLPVGVYRSTPNGRLLDANPALVAMLGYPDRERLLAIPTPMLYADPADRTRWSAEMSVAGFVRDFDVRKRRLDGSVIWTRDTTRAIAGPGGAIVLYEGILEDITDRVETDKQLKASERRLAQILEAVPIGIFVSDRDGRPVFVNAAATRVLGTATGPGVGVSALAQTYNVYVAGTNQYYPTERMPLVRALGGEATSVDDMEIHNGDSAITINVQGAPIYDVDGNVVAAVAVFMDTTERRALESQLRQASKMEAVGQLAGGIAHDFNNLLTVIISYASMLLESIAPGDTNREDVKEISAAADRAAGLTRQLLAFSRKQVMQPKVMNLNTAVRDVENMLRRLIGEHIELRTFLAPDAGWISADPGQIEQVLMNLVLNARDAMPGGGELEIRTAKGRPARGTDGPRRSHDADWALLSVRDTGTGITKEVQQRLFDPFFTTKEQGRGTGLGLSTVYGIVQQSGAEIRVDSEPGQGATFTLYFPRLARAAEEIESGSSAEPVARGSETLLLIEDDANLRALAVRVLRDSGYQVLVAADGQAALTIASDPATHIDGVVSDVVMPGMNGREAVEKLLEARPTLSFLFMSGYTDDDVLRRGLLTGDMPFLAKPFTPEQLARKVREVLDTPAVMGLRT